MKKENSLEEHQPRTPQISKGLALLQKIASRIAQDPDKKLLQGSGHSHSQMLSNVAQTLSSYNEKVSELRKRPTPASFVTEMEELKKAFLMRPGCPQFSTRTTSVSHVGSSTMADLPKDPCTTSGTWRTTDYHPLDRKSSATSVDGRFFSSSKSACELNYSKKKSEPPGTSPSSSPAIVKRSQRNRIPWYISVIHEKNHSLFLLGEELQRLSELEIQMQKKDQEILMLQKERETLKRQLKSLLRSKAAEMSSASIKTEQSFDTSMKLGRMSMLKTMYKEEEGQQPWTQMQKEYSMADSSKELHMGLGKEEEKSSEGSSMGPLKKAVSPKPRPSTGKIRTVPREGFEEEEEEGEEEAEEEEEAKGAEEGEIVLEEEQEMWELKEEEEEEVVEEEHRPKAFSLTESFEEELMAHLEEYERMLTDYQKELEITRTRYSLATGAITSLQRQIEFQESQLRKVTTENELLEKELRERKQQIQAMTDKFSSLREEKKHQEMMGLIEKENLFLRQQVSDLEAEVTKDEQAIAELHNKTRELQAQVNQDKDQLRRWKELHDDLQSRNEMIQQAEQQTRVVLEGAQIRLERLRNKIIQAVYSVSGTKNLSTELSDNYILDSLQKIITERSDFYSQLKQKGVKVPPLQQSDVFLSKTKKAPK
ncbi:coiled-coil domain-containing protein 27 [Meriones unguiculatus]|uniref:coiled-coil domain-containing protein 27 n=1 Tax=Meriones unguiculatus TaxID=10047 RepID=UPI000B4ED750|nr:coiled-coil domain-containing protein 27 [Meriones unguiculatus]